MKRLFLSVILLLTVSYTFASNVSPVENVKLEVKTISKTETTVVDIEFNSFENFNSFDTNQLNIFDSLNNDVCEASVTVTVSIGVGATYVSVTVTVTVPCDQVTETIQALKEELEEAITGG